MSVGGPNRWLQLTGTTSPIRYRGVDGSVPAAEPGVRRAETDGVFSKTIEFICLDELAL